MWGGSSSGSRLYTRELHRCRKFDGVSIARTGAARLRPALLRSILLSIPLSIDPDIIRHPEGPTTADHAVRQRITDFLPDFSVSFRCLISVRSVVQLYPGPCCRTYCPAYGYVHKRGFCILTKTGLLSIGFDESSGDGKSHPSPPVIDTQCASPYIAHYIGCRYTGPRCIDGRHEETWEKLNTRAGCPIHTPH
jgi:hypothetical protein